jgi:hypothetical protein
MAPKKMTPRAVSVSTKMLAFIREGLSAILRIVSLMFPGTINAGCRNNPLLKEVIN